MTPALQKGSKGRDGSPSRPPPAAHPATSLNTFFAKFDELGDAPDSVAKFRDLLLDLAVQGRLVEQNPAEGDGHALLQLIREKSSASDIEADVESMDIGFPTVPDNWATSQLGAVAEIIRGVSFPGSAKSKMRSKRDVACLRTASVQAEIDWNDLIYISPAYVSRPDQWVEPNDIIISMANSYALVGKVAIVRQVPEKATFGAFLAAIRPVLIEPYFLLYILRSPRMQAAFRASSSQTTNIANISLGRMRPLPFPLPPLAEQKRIVAKVDELMALCDRLEAQLKSRDEQHAALARAALARFAEAPTPANLELLFHDNFAISPADLRKTILTLAVQGKLVPQDSSDEPASEFVRRLQVERKDAFALEVIRAQREGIRPPRPPRNSFIAQVADEDRDLPFNWCVTRVGDVSDCLDYLRIPVNKGERLAAGGTVPYYGANGQVGWIDKHLFDEDLVLVVEDETFIGRTKPFSYVIRGKSWVNNHAHVLRPLGSMTADFLNLVLCRYPFTPLTSGTTNRRKLTQPSLMDAEISLPPLAEQRRIVAKVDQLMALVDKLEAQLTASRTTADHLLSAFVAELTKNAENTYTRTLVGVPRR